MTLALHVWLWAVLMYWVGGLGTVAFMVAGYRRLEDGARRKVRHALTSAGLSPAVALMRCFVEWPRVVASYYRMHRAVRSGP